MNTNRSVMGIGVLLQTSGGIFLFQERDNDTDRNPGMITPFGGEINKDETPIKSAIRELKEELELEILEKDLKDIGNFESHFAPGTCIKIYLIENINPEDLILHEGKNIVGMTGKEALENTKVTDFTKEVLLELEKHHVKDL